MNAYNSNHIKDSISEACRQLRTSVGSTMGPNGYNVSIMTQANTAMRVTKDGATVAENEHSDDNNVDGFIKSITQVAKSVEEEVGDGTTSATVMSTTLLLSLMDLVGNGHHPRLILRDMNMLLDYCVKQSSQLKSNIDMDNIGRIAMVSTNHDRPMANMVADIVKSIGPHGRFKCTTGYGDKDIHTSNSGFTLDHGVINPVMLGDNGSPFTGRIKYDIIKGELSLGDVKDSIALNINPDVGDTKLLILCDKVSEDEYLQITSLAFKLKTEGFDLLIVELSSVPYVREQQYRDIVGVTDGTWADMVIESGKLTILLDDEDADDYINQVAGEVNRVESGFDLEMHKDRLQRLRGGYANIMVSGITKAAMDERRDRVRDAILASQSALREGTVVGGGIHYLDILLALEERGDCIPTYLMDSMHKYLTAIFDQVHVNSGLDDDTVSGLLEMYSSLDKGHALELIDFSTTPSVSKSEEFAAIDSAGTPARIFEATRSIITTLLPIKEHVKFNATKFRM